MRTSRLAAGALALLVACASASAQQPETLEGHQVLTDAQFAALPATTPDGQKFSIVYAKFHKQFNELLKLVNAPQSLQERLIVRDPKLRELLNRSRDSTNEPTRTLTPRGNLQVIGTGKRVGQAYVLEVSRVLILESDLEYARRHVAALPPRDARGRQELSKYLQGRLQRYFQDATADQVERRELVAIMRQLEEDVRTIELEQLPPLPGGAETHIEFGRRYQALTILSTVADHPEVSPDMRARAEQALEQDLKAQRYLGRWYRYEDFKDLVGFAQAGQRWVPRERAELLHISEAERQRLRKNEEPISVLPESLLAKSKEVVRGMNKDMALSILQDYPVRVDRLREQLSPTNTTQVVFEQWVMDGGQRIYFVNGLVFQKID
jgi:hypothetical protein